MSDSQRFLQWTRQATPGTMANVLEDVNFVESFEHDPHLEKEIRKYKNNRRWMATKGYSKTRYDELTVRGAVDATEIGVLLCGAAGPPIRAGWAWIWRFGFPQAYPITATNTQLLSAAWGDGAGSDSPPAWHLQDGRVNTFAVRGDANGTISYEATIRGITPDPLYADAALPTYVPPVDNTPFAPWQTVVLYGVEVAVCVLAFSVTINNNYDPLYSAPQTAPSGTAPPGLQPARFIEGEVIGEWSILADFGTIVTDFVPGAPYYDYRYDVEANYLISAVDASTTLAGGQHPRFEIQIPKAFATSGKLDRSAPYTRQDVKGQIFYDRNSATGMNILLNNARASYDAA